MLRMFIAVKVAQSLREAVGELIDGLRSSGGDVKWVKPENLHLTLKFLGNVDETRVEEIEKAVSKASDGTAPFQVSLSGLGAFPDLKRPRVVWVGVEKGKDTLVSLSQRIEDGLTALGFEKEKRGFSPHLTVGRLRRGGRPGDLPDRLGVQFDTEAYTVERVYLMKSTLTPRGPIYEELRQVILEEKD